MEEGEGVGLRWIIWSRLFGLYFVRHEQREFFACNKKGCGCWGNEKHRPFVAGDSSKCFSVMLFAAFTFRPLN